MINSVFDKTMERVDHHRDIKSATTEAKLNQLEHKPNWMKTYNFGNKFSAVELSPTRVREHKPIYTGQAILDISRTLLYELHYGYMVPKYGFKQHLMYNDMDSMIYGIQTENVYADIALYINRWFDTSNYPPTIDRPLPIGRNKKVIGKTKNEVGGSIITKFIALRFKSYSLETLKSSTCSCKGVKRYITQGMTHTDFEHCLLVGEQIYMDQLSFRTSFDS